jgi:hypothetical protein
MEMEMIRRSLMSALSEPDMVTPKQNKINTANMQKNWFLGPEETSVDPSDNKEYWSKLAEIMTVTEAVARRRFCSNCEYGDNTPEMLKAMEAIPLGPLDMDGGGRVYCHKFDFVCHNLRVCQVWEKRDYIEPEDEEEDYAEED